MKWIAQYFWAICVVVTLAGLFVPVLGWPFAPGKLAFLAGILFFTGLKMDFRAAVAELRRPGLLLYASAMMLIVLPLAMWGLAHLLVPAFAVGVLIVAAMPAGLACGSLTDIARGNVALALVATLATSLLCPLLTPWVIALGGGSSQAGLLPIVQQALFLAAVLLVPMAAAFATRRLLPKLVARVRPALTGLSIISLSLLILGIMSEASPSFLKKLHEDPAQAAGIIGFMFLFSAVLRVAGYWLAPWRPPADRAALSIDAAYVNNGLAMVFADQFFRAIPDAALPAVLLEIPMVLAILPVRAYLARRVKREAGQATDTSAE